MRRALAFQRLVPGALAVRVGARRGQALGDRPGADGSPKPKGPGTLERMWQALEETWDELGETVRSYRIFH